MLLTKHKGQGVDTYNYDVFGNNYDGTFLSRNAFGFNGKRFDPAVKLYDYGFRDYSPVQMRWTTIDPICAGLNWYAYCNNDPVNFVDPFGLSPSDKKYLQIPTIPKFEYSGFLLNVPAVVDNCVINVGNGFIDLGNSLLYTAQYTWNNGLKETGKEIVREFQALGNNIVETGKVIGQGYLNSFNNYLKDPKAQFNSEIAYLKKTVTSPQTYETVGTIVAGIYTGKAISSIKIPQISFVSTETKVEKFAYRALNAKDAERLSQGLGLEAKNPEGNWNLGQHIREGSSVESWVNDPYISTTLDKNIAKAFNQNGSQLGIIKIDLTKVPANSKFKGFEIYPRVNGIEGLPYHYSVWQQEISIFQQIPKEAIVRILKR